jgi:N-acetyl sugar amidotransferase
MKILFIAPLPPPITGHSLASKVFLDELIKYHQVKVIHLTKHSFKQGVDSFKRIIQILRILIEVWGNKNNVDVIYFTISESFSGNIKDLLIYLICLRKLQRMVVHLHGGSIIILFNKHKLLFRINKYFIRRLGGVIMLGQSHVDNLSNIFINNKVYIVPNFAEDYLFQGEDKIKYKFSNTNPLKILFLSNLIAGKGHVELVDAYLELNDKLKKKVRIDFAGGFESDIQKKKFLSKIDGIKGIQYHGIVDGAEKKDLFSRAHIFCLPTSLNEGQPISILEAYASGCVVVTTDQGGIHDIFKNNINGFEVQKNSANSIKSVIEQIYEKTEFLLPMAIFNREIAHAKYRTSNYNAFLIRIIENIGSSSNDLKCKIINKSKVTTRCHAIYQICSNCIMDTTDPDITFDDRGWCDYCRNYYKNILPNWYPSDKGEKMLSPLIDKIKKDGIGRDHDCLIGISGGVDSSYVAYLSKEKFGLRPLIFHVDTGWNSQEAVNNIERLIDGLSLDLHTEVVDWIEMKDLQLAFFKAQVPHVDTPQDHAIFAALYNFAAKNRFKYVLTGANYATECVREPLEWHYHASDLRQIKDIHRRFGQRPLNTFPLADIFKFKLYYRFIKRVRVVKPLNYVRYNKEEAMQELIERFGWQKYAHKHYESRFTRFYEGYWLPKKFGYDKRRAHFSSVILTNQMSREEALKRIAQPAYDERTMAQDFEYVAVKLDLTVPELQKIMDGENKTYRDYKSSMPLISLATKILRMFGIQKVIIR